jgi:hypothetical protein
VKTSSVGLVLAVGSLFGSALAQAASPRLDPSPTFVSLVVFSGGESFSNRFGHIDLRFSYGPSPKAEDPTVGFGPRLLKDSNYAPLAFIGIGDKVPMFSWNESFEMRYTRASREELRRVTTLVLDLSEQEKSEVVEAMNSLLTARDLKPYNALLRNCSSVVAGILREASGISGGVLGFLPARLEKKLRRHALARQVLPSGRDLKTQVLEKHVRVLENLFPDAMERDVFQAQLMSVQTESRIVAYRRLQLRSGSSILLEDLLRTESESRRALIESKMKDPKFASTQRVLSLRNGQNLRRLEIVGSSLLIETETPSQQASAGPRRNDMSARRAQSLWELRSLGLPNKPAQKWRLASKIVGQGEGKQLHFWLAPDLQLDP